MNYEERSIETNGVRLHTILAGPEEGPLVVLLHGFPEFWYGWRRQIDVLASAGYRVAVPDQRGYNTSDKPPGVAAYGIDLLAADAVGIFDALGRERGTLVGHDWGAAVTWWAALRYPEHIERIVILNVPHPIVMRAQMKKNVRQLLRSWYMFFFQLPKLPEVMFRIGKFSRSAAALQKTSRPDTFSDEDLAKYRAVWAEPGVVTGMINWYRALMRVQPARLASVRVKIPTLMIWGTQDRFLGRELAQPSIDLCDQGRLEFIEEATHWVQHEEPERVNRLLLDFLA
ncbi:MAG: alpha/beta hydrolase [Pirellulales bacterium]|nr:alpha/beta hydrolase [Pirellulales bacterium]